MKKNSNCVERYFNIKRLRTADLGYLMGFQSNYEYFKMDKQFTIFFTL